MGDENKITDICSYTYNPNKDIGNRSLIQLQPLDAESVQAVYSVAAIPIGKNT